MQVGLILADIGLSRATVTNFESNNHISELRYLLLIIIASVFICLAPFRLFGQDKRSDTLTPQNQGQWIEYMNQYISLKFGQNSDIERIAVLTDDKDIRLSPNAKSVSRLSFNYKFISFDINYIAKFLPGNDDDAIKGTTKGSGFGFNLNFRHWLQALSYTKTKGYYLENTSEWDPSWTPGDPYAQFPELVFKNYQGITSYNFNPRFSVNALTTQTERQLKSAGSFIPHLVYRYYTIENKSTPTPGGSRQKSNNFEVVLGAGYYYNFIVKKNVFFSIGAAPGAGYIFTKLTTLYPTGNVVTNQQGVIFRLDGRAGLGYNGRRFFTGVYMKVSASTYGQENTTAINEDSRTTLQAFVGYRLNAPKWLKNTVQSVSDKTGIK